MNFIDRVLWICCTSVDDARTSIKNEDDLDVVKACLHYERRHSHRTSMIRLIEARIRDIQRRKGYGRRCK